MVLRNKRKRVLDTSSLRKQPTFRDATADWRLKNERRNAILMTYHYPDLGCNTSSVWIFAVVLLAGKLVVVSRNLPCFFWLGHKAQRVVKTRRNANANLETWRNSKGLQIEKWEMRATWPISVCLPVAINKCLSFGHWYISCKHFESGGLASSVHT